VCTHTHTHTHVNIHTIVWRRETLRKRDLKKERSQEREVSRMKEEREVSRMEACHKQMSHDSIAFQDKVECYRINRTKFSVTVKRVVVCV